MRAPVLGSGAPDRPASASQLDMSTYFTLICPSAAVDAAEVVSGAAATCELSIQTVSTLLCFRQKAMLHDMSVIYIAL